MARFTYDEDRERPLGPDTELRVHGVGGTSPESLLYEHHPILVGGDEIAGFFRPRDRKQTVEAYAWGGLTARSSVRALWIALLPFALVNVAGWMIPRRPDTTRGRHLLEPLIRMIAVGSTVAVIALVAAISVDIFALQCGGNPECSGESVWLKWMRSSFFAESPSRLILVGLIAPLVVLVVLWYLGRSTSAHYEARFPLSEPSGDSGLSAGLAQATLWHEADRVRSFGLVHVGAATALLAAATSWTLFRAERYAAGMFGEWEAPITSWLTGWRVVLWLSVGVLIGCAAVAGGGEKAAGRSGRYLAAGGIGLLIAAVVDGFRPRPTFPDDLSWMGMWFSGFMWSTVFPILLLLIAVLLIGLVFVRRRHMRAERTSGQDASWPPAMAGLAPAVVVSIGMIAVASVLAGLALALAEMLGSRRRASGEPYIRVFSDWEVVALGLLVFLAVIGLWLIVRWLRLRSPRARDDRLDAIEAEWFSSVGVKPPPPRDSGQAVWLGRIDRLRQIRAEWIPSLDTPLWLGVVVAIAIAVLYIADREMFDGGIFLRYVFVERHPWTETLLALAGWLVVLLPAAAWALLWRSFRDPDLRRTVGTLWDVLTFWPRWFHPFAPPPYTARAVPELVTRLEDRLLDPLEPEHPDGNRVVLSAHSQGSVIAVAALLQLEARRTRVDKGSEAGTTLDRIALVTHGSPLASLYNRFFPAFFDTQRLGEMRQVLTGDTGVRWRNLYRLTDPIGRRLFEDDRVDREVGDPPSSMPKAGDPLPPPRGHSDYYLDPTYWEAIETLFDSLPARQGGTEHRPT